MIVACNLKRWFSALEWMLSEARALWSPAPITPVAGEEKLAGIVTSVDDVTATRCTGIPEPQRLHSA